MWAGSHGDGWAANATSHIGISLIARLGRRVVLAIRGRLLVCNAYTGRHARIWIKRVKYIKEKHELKWYVNK